VVQLKESAICTGPDAVHQADHKSCDYRLWCPARHGDIPTWIARLEMCQWRSETLDKESIWDEARSTSLSKW
jgi:hypothetical protein